MAYSTGNPPGSTDPRDMFDNAHTFDNLIVGDQPFYPDRLDKQRLSWSGMEYNFEAAQTGREAEFVSTQADKEARFQAFLVSSGYVSKGDYAAGVVLLERNEYVAVDAATTGTTAGLYRPGPNATLPLTLSGDWATDEPLLRLLGDDALRQELASPEGADKVGYKSRTQADRNADFVSVFDYMTADQIASVKAKDYLVNVTDAVNLCLSENPNVAIPNGGYLVDHLTIPATLVHLYGAGKNGVTFRHAPGATGALWRWAGIRVMNSRFVGTNLEGNGEAGETYGFDLTGFSYCEFASCRARLFKLDGWFTDGAITPVNKQNSNNTFVGCTGNNNQRDGIRLTGTDPQRYENTCNTFIGCEFAGNGGRGVNGEVCESSQWLGCTAQGNVGRDVYFNSRFSVFTGYLEGAAKAVELGPLSYGCKVEIRSGYPLWNTFADNGKSNTCSVMGEREPAAPVFVNPFFTDWISATPAGVALMGSPALASYVDSGSPFGAGLQLTVGADFQGLAFSMSQPASALAGQWVTLLLEIETAGVTDPLQMRVYARDGSTINSTNGQYAVEAIPVTAAGVYRRMAYDVKFPDAIAGVPTVLWYAAYSGVSAGGNVIKIRSARIVLGQTREATLFSGDPHKPVAASGAQLALASGGINVHRKFVGKQVYDTTAGKLRFAVSNSPTSAWRASDGSGDLTPA